MPELGQHARVASSSAAEGRTATSTKNTGSRSTSRWIGRSMQAAIVVLVVLLALSSDGVVKSVRGECRTWLWGGLPACPSILAD